MAGRPKKLHLSQVSPVLEVRSRLTFGTAASSSECLHTDAASPTSKPGTALIADKFQNATLQQQNAAPGTAQQAPPSLPKSVPFGRSRRMSRSLPELRDMQFVSVLPDVGEEDEDDEDDEGRSLSSDQYREDGEGVGVGGGDMGSDAKRRRRLPWLRKLDFVWSSVCHALGFANIWRFPYYCYSNGGGSFVVPYLIFFVVCGIPFVCMELAVGQLTQSGPIAAFGQLCPLMKGIGVSSLMLSFWLTTYYSVLSSWTLFYTFNSFYSPPRWTRCTNTWNSDTCHDPDAIAAAQPTNHTTPANHSSWINNFTHPAAEFIDVKLLEKSSSLEVTGELRFELLASVLFVWILSYFALRKTDFLRGSALYVLTLAAHLLLFCLFLRTVALDGAKTGLRQLFQPDWQRMFTPRVLLYALAQAFHSLGVVLGPSILMGSCHKQHNNLLRDTIVLSAVTLLTVLVIGCITFATIGHLALKLDKPFWTVLQDDPSVVFVVYSVVVGSMPLPSCWGVLFYLVLLFLGLDSQIKLMATLVSALKEAYTLYIKQRFQGHSLFLAVICGFCFAIAIPYITQAGIFFFQLVDHYTAVVATTVVAFFEVLTLGVLYGPGNLSSCIRQMTGKPPSYFYQFCWMILAPFTILITVVYWCIAGASSSQMVKTGYQYPEWAHALGWVIFALTVCWIPALAVAAYRKMPDSDIINKLRAATQPRLRSPSDSRWEAKPVIILNGSTVTASEFPDYKMPELPGMPNAVQSYVDKHAPQVLNKDETAF